jgi:nitrite reductase/ring-hydroxylating ferredoxin subunit
MPAATVCQLEEIPPGSSKVVSIGRLSIGIFNVDGRLFALSNTCPHRGGPLCTGPRGGIMAPGESGEYRYEMDGMWIRCPWHHWEYNLETGRSFVDPDRYRAIVYPVRLDGTSVIVDTEGRT